MKTFRILIVPVAALALTSCADKTAIAYAEELLAMLNSLSAQAGKKLSDEMKRYREEARDFEEFKDTDALSSLRIARTTASSRTVLDQVLAGRTTGSQVLNALLPEYAELDLTTTQRIYEKRADAHLDAIRTLQDLSLDHARLKGLRDAVEVLTKKPDLLALGAQYAQFAKDLKGNLDFHECTDLSRQIDALTKEVTGIEGKIKALGASDAAALARLNSDLKLAQASLKIDEAKRKSTGRYDETKKTCSRP